MAYTSAPTTLHPPDCVGKSSDPQIAQPHGAVGAGCTVLDVRQAPHETQELVRTVGELVGHAQAQAVKRAREHALLGLALVVHRARHQLGCRSPQHTIILSWGWEGLYQKEGKKKKKKKK